jgi:phage tail-like protein
MKFWLLMIVLALLLALVVVVLREIRRIRMAVQRDEPYAGCNFRVILEGNEINNVTDVVFPDAKVKTFEYRSGNEKQPASRKLTTTTEYTNLILKRGAIGSLDWYNWWNQVRNGDHNSAKKDVTVELLSEDRAMVALTWKFSTAVPVSYGVSPLGGLENGAVVETLELSVERMEMQ